MLTSRLEAAGLLSISLDESPVALLEKSTKSSRYKLNASAAYSIYAEMQSHNVPKLEVILKKHTTASHLQPFIFTCIVPNLNLLF